MGFSDISIFQNEITTILTPSTLEVGEYVFYFGGPWLQILNDNILISPPSEVEGVTIVVISFRNIAKN